MQFKINYNLLHLLIQLHSSASILVKLPSKNRGTSTKIGQKALTGTMSTPYDLTHGSTQVEDDSWLWDLHVNKQVRFGA